VHTETACHRAYSICNFVDLTYCSDAYSYSIDLLTFSWHLFSQTDGLHQS